MFSSTQVADIVGVKFYQINYAHKTEKIPEPQKIGGNRVYTVQETLAVARHFGSNEEEVLSRIAQLRGMDSDGSSDQTGE